MGKYMLIAVGIAILTAIILLSVSSKARAPNAGSVTTMTRDGRIGWFWDIIERTRSSDGDQDRQRAALAEELSKLSPAEIEAFGAIFDLQLAETYSWDLWGAAYVVMGGASDDSFEYFRVWLISRGRDVFRSRADRS